MENTRLEYLLKRIKVGDVIEIDHYLPIDGPLKGIVKELPREDLKGDYAEPGDIICLVEVANVECYVVYEPYGDNWEVMDGFAST